MVGRRVSSTIQKERENIVCRMKLEGWTTQQIASHIGTIGRGVVSGMVAKLKREGRLPRRFMRGTKNPPTGVGYNIRRG